MNANFFYPVPVNESKFKTVYYLQLETSKKSTSTMLFATKGQIKPKVDCTVHRRFSQKSFFCFSWQKQKQIRLLVFWENLQSANLILVLYDLQDTKKLCFQSLAKGHLISECLFGVFNASKKQTKTI